MSDSAEQLYHLSYQLRVNDPPLTKAEALLQRADFGACNAAILMSILYPPDGSYSLMVLSKDGRNAGKELDGNELFKAWMLWAHNLKSNPTLSPGRRELVAMIYDILVEAVFGKRPPASPQV